MFKIWYIEMRLGMFKKNIAQDKKEAPGLGSALAGGIVLYRFLLVARPLTQNG